MLYKDILINKYWCFENAQVCRILLHRCNVQRLKKVMTKYILSKCETNRVKFKSIIYLVFKRKTELGQSLHVTQELSRTLYDAKRAFKHHLDKNQCLWMYKMLAHRANS